ncbi:recombination protein RecO [Campylobacter pinnipediorum subsp. pinnipediorum]|uniref:recombination protein RecO n=1 Tax=Campylobacter pinnipediorum TaxID=1965231 RepID=UPI000994D0E4|nr:recombination protein RecO [Campylobacter pinnipediorum]OPA79643.1 recombination protein RecO [Campylobacter pinnipediorum subsp. pinnipediorum]
MQGYILHTQKVKEEDLIVYILTDKLVVKSYRFYGARHSILVNGYKIDFELISSMNFLPHLRTVLHMGFKWLLDREKFIVWQQFMRLLYMHLKDVEEIDEVYFNEIDFCAKRMDKQNPKRLILQSYVKILEHEGRLHSEFECFICDEVINDDVCFGRSFLPGHKNCLNKFSFELKKIEYLFDNKSTLMLDDRDVNELYSILLEGF